MDQKKILEVMIYFLKLSLEKSVPSDDFVISLSDKYFEEEKKYLNLRNDLRTLIDFFNNFI